MKSDHKSTILEKLPVEVVLHVVSFLQPEELIPLQRVCQGFYRIARDDEVWRNACFQRSRRKQALLPSLLRPSQRGGEDADDLHRLRDLRRALSSSSVPIGASSSNLGTSEAPARAKDPAFGCCNGDAAHLRKLANWDPTYPGEHFDWYTEYVARNAPTSLSWLQQPHLQGSKSHGQYLDVSGLAFHADSQSCRAVAPLEDGSMAIWDLRHETDLEATSIRRGAVVARSKPGLLSPFGFSSALEGIHDMGNKSLLSNVYITDSISIDHVRNKAFIAVGRALNEVDLETLHISTVIGFTNSITALSKVDHPLPLTVGTQSGIHLFDPRAPTKNGFTMLEPFATPQHRPPHEHAQSHPTSRLHLMMQYDHALHDIIQHNLPHQRGGPLSLLHLPASSSPDPSSTDIYAAGRFPSILVYDRRLFPKIRATHHSGASLCGLTSLPYPHCAQDADAMSKSQLSVSEVQAAKSHAGNTLVACGEYKSKGSLELYSLPADSAGFSDDKPAVFKNRVDAASSKLLSVATHGSRILVSDGGGELRWLERDGHTLVRKLQIKHHAPEDFSTTGIFNISLALDTGDAFGAVARKVLPTDENVRTGRVDSDEVLIWTGQKIGVLGFTATERFGGGDWKNEGRKSAEEKMRERAEGEYARGMGWALRRQADEVRWVRGLGLGEGFGS